MADTGHISGRMGSPRAVVIDACRLQKLFAKRKVEPVNAVVEACAGDIDDLANQREAVGVNAGRGKRDGDIAFLWHPARQQRAAFGGADGKAGKVEPAIRIDARHLGRLAADQGGLALDTAIGDAGNNLGGDGALELAGCEIVQEEQWNSTLCNQVVDAHGHQIDAEAAITADGARQFQLGADTVRRGDKDRVVEPCRLQVEQPAEPAQRHIRAGTARARGIRPDIADEGVSGVDINPGVTIAERITGRSFV